MNAAASTGVAAAPGARAAVPPGVPAARAGVPAARTGVPAARTGVPAATPAARAGVPVARAAVPGARTAVPGSRAPIITGNPIPGVNGVFEITGTEYGIDTIDPGFNIKSGQHTAQFAIVQDGKYYKAMAPTASEVEQKARSFYVKHPKGYVSSSDLNKAIAILQNAKGKNTLTKRTVGGKKRRSMRKSRRGNRRN